MESFLLHLARGNPSDYTLAVRKGQMVVAQEGRPARPIRTGAFVRRFWALFVLPPPPSGVSGLLRLSDLSATASQQALAPGTLPNTFAAEVAERFAAAAPVLDMFEHTLLQGAAMRSTYHDMGAMPPARRRRMPCGGRSPAGTERSSARGVQRSTTA